MFQVAQLIHPCYLHCVVVSLALGPPLGVVPSILIWSGAPPSPPCSATTRSSAPGFIAAQSVGRRRDLHRAFHLLIPPVAIVKNPFNNTVTCCPAKRSPAHRIVIRRCSRSGVLTLCVLNSPRRCPLSGAVVARERGQGAWNTYRTKSGYGGLPCAFGSANPARAGLPIAANGLDPQSWRCGTRYPSRISARLSWQTSLEVEMLLALGIVHFVDPLSATR